MLLTTISGLPSHKDAHRAQSKSYMNHPLLTSPCILIHHHKVQSRNRVKGYAVRKENKKQEHLNRFNVEKSFFFFWDSPMMPEAGVRKFHFLCHDLIITSFPQHSTGKQCSWRKQPQDVSLASEAIVCIYYRNKTRKDRQEHVEVTKICCSDLVRGSQSEKALA